MTALFIPLLLKALILLGVAILIREIAQQHRSQPAPTYQTRHRPTHKEQELIRLLYGDAEQAHRLIRQAGGSVDKAIAQLISDRSL